MSQVVYLSIPLISLIWVKCCEFVFYIQVHDQLSSASDSNMYTLRYLGQAGKLKAMKEVDGDEIKDEEH